MVHEIEEEVARRRAETGKTSPGADAIRRQNPHEQPQMSKKVTRAVLPCGQPPSEKRALRRLRRLPCRFPRSGREMALRRPRRDLSRRVLPTRAALRGGMSRKPPACPSSSQRRLPEVIGVAEACAPFQTESWKLNFRRTFLSPAWAQGRILSS